MGNSSQSAHAAGTAAASGTPVVSSNVSKTDFSVPVCYPVSTADVNAMIKQSGLLTAQSVLNTNTLTFKVKRPAASSVGMETLVIEGIHLDWTKRAHFDAYLYFPTSNANTTICCPEFLGTFINVPHAGPARASPPRRWRTAVGDKLRALGKDTFSHVVVTLVQSTVAPQAITFRGARVAYEQ